MPAASGRDPFMADPPGFRRNDADSEVGPERRSAPRMPRWVKVSAIVAAILIALLILVNLTGFGGEHGPGRHAPGEKQEQGHDPSRWDHP